MRASAYMGVADSCRDLRLDLGLCRCGKRRWIKDCSAKDRIERSGSVRHENRRPGDKGVWRVRIGRFELLGGLRWREKPRDGRLEGSAWRGLVLGVRSSFVRC